jgi:hypothetical protein
VAGTIALCAAIVKKRMRYGNACNKPDISISILLVDCCMT